MREAEVSAIPYPSDTRAKGWRFELDYERIRQSDTWALAAPEIRPWLLMLWMTAWEQTPCGSLPDDDELIAARIGMSLEQFQSVKKRLMRGWWLADDGRLYHNTMVERVLEMIDRRDGERIRKANQRAKKEAERAAADDVAGSGCPADSGNVPDMSHGTDAGLPEDSNGTDATGTGTGTGTSSKPKTPGTSGGVGALHARSENTPLSAAEISTSLRDWERGRGKAVRNLTPSQQQVIDLAAARPTALELRKAYELAVEDRDNANDPGPINANFVRTKLERVRRPPRASPQPTWSDKNAETIAALTGRNRSHEPDDRTIDV
ncbi:TPA: DUF1376 domain-containing protein [Burkholderia multivorans]|nr:DUF1376 domain-containing protein [Burkholderia multivorans]MBU9240988.1 DUF1376 domain-containing protein [Burkholderia multivorans]HEF4749733.1 DUF1376 domain-containing protein [Burkholderia multivorans]